MRAIGDVAGCGAGISCKARGEGIRVAQRVKAVRIAIVTERPDRQDSVTPLGVEEGVDAREVVLAVALVDEGPGEPFAGRGDAEGGEEAVIFVCMGVVLQFFRDVAAAATLPVEGRAFEAGQEEGREDAVAGHGSTTRERPWRFACSTSRCGL